MWVGRATWQHYLSMMAQDRAEISYLQEKVDRLTEALLKKDVHTVVQLPPAPMVRAELPTVSPAAPVVPTERTEQWLGNGGWMGSGGHAIATPPKERKVSAP